MVTATLPAKWRAEASRALPADSYDRGVAECLAECAARLDAALPTVIRDRRPTREEVHAASIGGVSLWLATVPWLAMPRTCWATTANPVTFLGVHNNRRSVSLDGSPAPGETWRPIGPDGEPLTLNVEVSGE